MKIIKKIILGIIIIFVALVMVGFLVPDNSNYTKGTETILSGLVANISKDSRVGIGNIYVSDYTNEAGVKKHGPVVSLEFHNLNNNPENKKILAYEGQIVNFGEQTIEIVKRKLYWRMRICCIPLVFGEDFVEMIKAKVEVVIQIFIFIIQEN